MQDRAPGFQGWNTTDDEELQRRRWRGLTDIAAVENLEPEYPYFGTFRVRSTSGGVYDVEIRSLSARENSCGCPDWRINGLGTCKHIEGVLEKLHRKGKRAFAAAALAGSPRAEIFPSLDGSCSVQLRFGPNGTKANAFLKRYATPAGTLAGDPLTVLPALQRQLSGAARFSRQLEGRLEEERRRRREDRDAFLADVNSGNATLGIFASQAAPVPDGRRDPALEPDSVAKMQEADVMELSGLRARLPPGNIADLASFGTVAHRPDQFQARRTAVQSLIVAARA